MDQDQDQVHSQLDQDLDQDQEHPPWDLDQETSKDQAIARAQETLVALDSSVALETLLWVQAQALLMFKEELT